MTTIPADYLFMLVLGLLFSWTTSTQIEKSRSLFWNRYFLGALVFQTFFCMPLAIYCYVVFPDWCWMYWVDSRSVPFPMVIAAFAGYYVWMGVGFTLGYRAESRTRGMGGKLLGGAILLLMIFCVLTWKRLFFVGSLKAFLTGNIPSLFARPVLLGLLVLGFGIALFVLVHLLSRFGRELDRHWSPQDQEKFEKKKRGVSIVRVNTDLAAAIRSSLEHWEGIDSLRQFIVEKGPRVILKPNFAGGGKDKAGTQTSPELIAAVIDLLREVNREVEILVAESGSIFWWDTERLLEESVYKGLFLEKEVRFVNLSREDRVWHDFGGRMGREEIPRILTEPHVLIDLPVAKTHSFFQMSGALKNLFGLTPVPFKLFRYHTKGFADYEGRIFIDIYRGFPPDFVVVDGTVSCEGNGPNGRAKKTDFIITSDDALCADFLLADVMKMEPRDVPYLKALLEDGFEPKYTLAGTPVEEVRPESWERPDRFRGLVSNFIGITGEHIKDRMKRNKTSN